MSGDPVPPNVTPYVGSSFELPVEELLRRARPWPCHEEMAREDLDEADGVALLAALGR